MTKHENDLGRIDHDGGTNSIGSILAFGAQSVRHHWLRSAFWAAVACAIVAIKILGDV